METNFWPHSKSMSKTTFIRIRLTKLVRIISGFCKSCKGIDKNLWIGPIVYCKLFIKLKEKIKCLNSST